MASGFLQYTDAPCPPPLPPPEEKSQSSSSSRGFLNGYTSDGLSKSKITLSQVVEDPGLRKIFETFCIDELAGENFLFWQEAEDYKMMEDIPERKRKLEEIYGKYFSVDTDTEVNLSGWEIFLVSYFLVIDNFTVLLL